MKFFKTTYQTLNNDNDEITAHLTYQLEFLRTFEIESYDDNAISTQLDAFYDEIQTNDAIMALLREEKEKNNFRSLDDALFILFSWDNLHRVADLMTSL
jgi:hypothetical protein